MTKKNTALKLLKDWWNELKDYDPYAPNCTSQFSSGAVGIEVEGIKKRVKEIIDKAENETESK